MGVFFCSLLLFLFLKQTGPNAGLVSYVSFLVVALVSPFVTYGLIFSSVIFISFYAFHIFLHDRKRIWQPIVLVIGFLLSLRACFLLTIVYQQNIPKYSIYDSYYPSGGFLDILSWIVKSIVEYINFPLGFSGGLLLLLIWGLGVLLIQNNSNQEPESRISKINCLLLIALTLFMLLLAFTHRYPFAGSRHLL